MGRCFKPIFQNIIYINSRGYQLRRAVPAPVSDVFQSAYRALAR